MTLIRDRKIMRSMSVSLAEEKLLRRLRQLRNQAEIAAVMVSLVPLSINPLGKKEELEIDKVADTA